MARRRGVVRVQQAAANPRRWRRVPWRTLADVRVVALAAWMVLWLTLSVWHSADFDVIEYAEYARAYWLGQPRFAALPQEYPPAALLVFGLALLPAGPNVLLVFGMWMGLLFVLGYVGLRRNSGVSAARRYAMYLLLGAQGTLLARFDLVPALAAVGALWAAQRRHFALGYLLLGVGILLKLYPVFLVPLVVIEHWRWMRQAGTAHEHGGALEMHTTSCSRDGGTRRGARAGHVLALGGAGICFASAAGVTGLALLRGSASALTALRYAVERPIQIESFQATLLWLGTFLGAPAEHSYAFGSDMYAGVLSGSLGVAAVVALAAGCGLVYWRLGTGKQSLARAFLASLCVVLLTLKVFSTQYLIWVLPFAAAVGDDVVLWLLVCALSFADYPLLYPFNQPGYTATETALFLALLAARNVALLVLTVRVLARNDKDAPGGARAGEGTEALAVTAGSEHPDSI